MFAAMLRRDLFFFSLYISIYPDPFVLLAFTTMATQNIIDIPLRGCDYYQSIV